MSHNLSQREKIIMKLNMGSMDRTIRLALIVVTAALYFANIISGTVAIILGVVAVIFLLTSIVGYCPLYSIVGLSTHSASKELRIIRQTGLSIRSTPFAFSYNQAE